MEQLIPWLMFCLAVLVVCLVRPGAGRIFTGLFFLVMAVGVNGVLVLISPVLFVALGALGDGIGLIVANGPGAPLELLRGSPFNSYAMPGLSLTAVGGSAMLAAAAVLWRHELSAMASVITGVMVIGFEVVEVLVVESPSIVALVQQVFWFAVGLLIFALATPSLVGLLQTGASPRRKELSREFSDRLGLEVWQPSGGRRILRRIRRGAGEGG